MNALRLLSITSVTILLASCTSAAPEHTNEHDDSMSMHEMTASLEGKTGDDFDKAFIDAMIEHHEGAVDMAELALEHAKHEAIHTLAEAIIEAQQNEIDLMNQWKEAWGY